MVVKWVVESKGKMVARRGEVINFGENTLCVKCDDGRVRWVGVPTVVFWEKTGA